MRVKGMNASSLCVAVYLGIFCLVLPGCASSALGPVESSEAPSSADRATGRILIKRAFLDVEVDDVDAAVKKALAIAETTEGYVETSTASKDESATIALRVPAAQFESTLDALAGLGKEKSRSVRAEDVTAHCIDLEAKLKNCVALRDRLRKLLDKATNVKDVLAIEKELTRVQTEADSLEGQLKSLRGLAKMASIRLTLTVRTILGPLGYLFRGVGWILQKLFVLRGPMP